MEKQLFKELQPNGTYILKYFYEGSLIAIVDQSHTVPSVPLTDENVDQEMAFFAADLGLDETPSE